MKTVVSYSFSFTQKDFRFLVLENQLQQIKMDRNVTVSASFWSMGLDPNQS